MSFLMFLGYAILFALRTNLSVAIIDMVQKGENLSEQAEVTGEIICGDRNQTLIQNISKMSNDS